MTGSNVWGATSDRGAKSPKVSWHGNTEINCAEGESKFLISLGKTLVFGYEVSLVLKDIIRTYDQNLFIIYYYKSQLYLKHE